MTEEFEASQKQYYIILDEKFRYIMSHINIAINDFIELGASIHQLSLTLKDGREKRDLHNAERDLELIYNSIQKDLSDFIRVYDLLNLQAVKFNLDKRIEEMKKLKELSNG